MTNRILLGKIGAAHGIKGQVRINFYGADESLLESCSVFTSETGDNSLKINITGHKSDLLLAGIDGVTDRNKAEGLTHTELWIDRDRLPALDADEIYYADLIGMAVLDKTGKEIGHVKAVDDFGAGPLLDITHGGDSHYLPFTQDNVPEVDMTGKRLTIDPPDGWDD